MESTLDELISYNEEPKMGEGTYDGGPGPEIYQVFDEIMQAKEVPGPSPTTPAYSAVRCQRVYGCIECRSTLSFMGNAPNGHELFQCGNQHCSMALKVLSIRENLIEARVIAP